MVLSPALSGPQWGKRLLQSIRPSAHNKDTAKSAADGPIDWDTESSSRSEAAYRLQQSDLKLESGPFRRGSSSRQTQKLVVDSGIDALRLRRRLRQGITPTAHLLSKPQHSPLLHQTPHIDEAKRARFACPFYKLDPDMYQDCRRFELTRVKDVKQHLQRKHFQPIYCSRCYDVFSTAELLKDHLRIDRPCELRDRSLPSSISKEQWEKLDQKYQSRGKPVEDQWRDFWYILFPGREPPRSVYLDNQVQETLSQLRSFWSSKRSVITSKAIRLSGAGALLSQPDDTTRATHLFGQLIESFLDQFEAETTGHGSDDENLHNIANGFPCDQTEEWKVYSGVASTLASDPYLTETESQRVSPSYGPILPWQTEQHHMYPARNLPTCASTGSLPETIYESKQYYNQHLIIGPADQRCWNGPCVEAHCIICSSVALPELGNPMALDTPSAPPQYRHTWPGTPSRPW